MKRPISRTSAQNYTDQRVIQLRFQAEVEEEIARKVGDDTDRGRECLAKAKALRVRADLTERGVLMKIDVHDV